jgi:hypothetical protein
MTDNTSVKEQAAALAESYSRGEDDFAELARRIRDLPDEPTIQSARLIPWEPGSLGGVDLTLSDGRRVALPITGD